MATGFLTGQNGGISKRKIVLSAKILDKPVKKGDWLVPIPDDPFCASVLITDENSSFSVVQCKEIKNNFIGSYTEFIGSGDYTTKVFHMICSDGKITKSAITDVRTGNPLCVLSDHTAITSMKYFNSGSQSYRYDSYKVTFDFVNAPIAQCFEGPDADCEYYYAFLNSDYILCCTEMSHNASFVLLKRSTASYTPRANGSFHLMKGNSGDRYSLILKALSDTVMDYMYCYHDGSDIYTYYKGHMTVNPTTMLCDVVQDAKTYSKEEYDAFNKTKMLEMGACDTNTGNPILIDGIVRNPNDFRKSTLNGKNGYMFTPTGGRTDSDFFKTPIYFPADFKYVKGDPVIPYEYWLCGGTKEYTAIYRKPYYTNNDGAHCSSPSICYVDNETMKTFINLNPLQLSNLRGTHPYHFFEPITCPNSIACVARDQSNIGRYFAMLRITLSAVKNSMIRTPEAGANLLALSDGAIGDTIQV